MLPILGLAPDEFVNSVIAPRMAALTLPFHPYLEINLRAVFFSVTLPVKNAYAGFTPDFLRASALSWSPDFPHFFSRMKSMRDCLK